MRVVCGGEHRPHCRMPKEPIRFRVAGGVLEHNTITMSRAVVVGSTAHAFSWQWVHVLSLCMSHAAAVASFEFRVGAEV